jgi:hypothetical protein
MSNKHYEHALEGLPCRVSTTAHIIYQIICYRFDDRITLPNGKPNPGYNKSYPGMDAFVKATGRTRQACNTAIELLIAKGLVARITIGKPGSRAEYVPIHTVNALGISVKNTLHVSKQYTTRKLADNVKNTNTMSKANLPNESSPLNTISTISIHKYDKLISLLPKDISQYIKPGKNIDRLLDKLDDQGMSIEAVSAHLSKQKYSDRYTLGGTVVTHLEALSGLNKPSKNRFKSEWCRKCDLNTRTFEQSSPGVDGKDTYQCPNCHPNQIRIKERMSSDTAVDNMFRTLMAREIKSEDETFKLLKSIDEA